MKVAYASDFHVEFDGHKVPPVPPGTDVLVLAGDISSGGKGIAWAYDTYKDDVKYIVVDYGNHDYWGKHHYQKVIEQARAFASDKPNLFFLELDAVQIEGVWFLGGTCWTDYTLGPKPKVLNMLYARDGMRDHDRIKFKTSSGQYRKFRPEDAEKINFDTRQFIFDKLREIRTNDPKAITVVVTHHGPTPLSLDPAFASSVLNPCYVSCWEYVILDQGPHVWIHGHVHQNHRYKIGNTVVLCNPIGYPDQIPGSGFKSFEISNHDSEKEA